MIVTVGLFSITLAVERIQSNLLTNPNIVQPNQQLRNKMCKIHVLIILILTWTRPRHVSVSTKDVIVDFNDGDCRTLVITLAVKC